MRSWNLRALLTGLAAMGVVLIGVVLGSHNLVHYDPVLLLYTFGVLFSAFAIAYRYAVWLQRPPTRVYWRRGWQLALRDRSWPRHLIRAVRGIAVNFFAQRFIVRRSARRGFAHLCFSWGTLLAVAVTFPLVLGWVHFETSPDSPEIYRVIFFGAQVDEFHVESFKRYVMFNLLNVSAVMVIIGVTLALHRRLSGGENSLARQQFGQDFVPLILLLAISVTGLMLTFSSHFMRGYGYAELSLLHAMTVIVTLVYLPFGKLFHIFQRPLHLSVLLYRRAGRDAPAACGVCGEAYTSARHVDDLKGVLADVGLPWDLAGPVKHYAEVCPRCRRRMLGVNQARVMAADRTAKMKQIDGEPQEDNSLRKDRHNPESVGA